MKKILLALTFLITLANAQVITPVLGGTQFTLPNSTTYFYSCNTEIYATIDAQNRARFYNKVGGQVFGAYYFYDISIDGDTLLSKTDFLQAINELPCFSAFEICGEVINAGLDSGEVIGNFLYLFQSNDTVIVDLSTLADTSLWEISEGKLQPKDTFDFKVAKNNYEIYNGTFEIVPDYFVDFSGAINNVDSCLVRLNGVIGRGSELQPYQATFNTCTFEETCIEAGYINSIGTQAILLKGGGFRAYGSSNEIVIFRDSTLMWGKDTLSNILSISAYDGSPDYNATSFANFSYQNSNIYDTKFDRDKITLPIKITEPSGNNGSIYYNDTDSVYRAYINGAWHTVLLVKDVTYLNDAAADADGTLGSGVGYQLTGDRAVYIKP